MSGTIPDIASEDAPALGAGGRETPGLLKHLSRRNASTRFIPEIDGLRFVAIAAVVAMHVASYAGGAFAFEHPGVAGHQGELAWRVLQLGRYGVQLFFVISGFVLALPFATYRMAGGRKVNLKWYYLRRLLRLEPPYIASLLLFVIVLSLLPSGHTATNGAQIGSFTPHLVSGLFYLHGFVFGTPNPLNAATWSLEVEAQFYLVVPLLVSVFALRTTAVRRGVLIVACVGLEIMQASWDWGSGRLGISLLGSLQYFLVGFLLADIYLNEWKSKPERRASWDLATLGAVVLIALTLPKPFGPYLFPALILLLFVGGFRGRWTSRLLSNPWIYTIGGMCYSIYLMHMLVIRLAFRVPGLTGGAGSFSTALVLSILVYIPVILVVSTLFFVLVERPCMNPNWPTALVRGGPFARTRKASEGISSSA